jgi:hypothetical protein
VRRHVVAAVAVVLLDPLDGFDGLGVTANADAGARQRDQLLCRRVPARVGRIEAAVDRAIPVVTFDAAATVLPRLLSLSPRSKQYSHLASAFALPSGV